NDARFFYANRCIIPYINEGLIMVTEGVAPALVENAAKQLGFPVGPLSLGLDAVDNVPIEERHGVEEHDPQKRTGGPER
ncbi:MAG: 3-hydroxyacyl-CoA dehydrogenase family protein, partial [Terriglobia bacterium]